MIAAPNTADVVRAILAKVALQADISLQEPLRVDSIQALRVLVELEKRFGVEIDEDDIFDGWFDTGERIAAYVERLVARRDGAGAHTA